MIDTPATFAAALRRAAAQVVAETRITVTKGAQNIKTEAKLNVLATAPTRNAHAHTAINYDVKTSAGAIAAEIGYDKDKKPGRFGNLLEFGGGKDHSPPHRDLGRALDSEGARFITAMERIAEVVIT